MKKYIASVREITGAVFMRGDRFMITSFYTDEELKTLGLKSYGHNVLISRKASIYGAENISIGHDVRIDDFCILSGKINLGSYIHISAYTALYAGEAGITLGNFSSISSRCVVYALTDDYSGQVLLNSMVPDEYKHIQQHVKITYDILSKIYLSNTNQKNDCIFRGLLQDS